MPQPLSVSTPTCPSCASLPPIEFDERQRVRVKQLLKIEQVLQELDGKWPTSAHTHAVRIEGIKAHYTTKPTTIQCAFEDRTHTPHFEGYIVETACGLLLNVGIDCGKRWIAGMEFAERAVGNTLRYDRNRTAIEHDPLELQLALSALDKRVGGLRSAQKSLVAHLATTVSRRMRDAAESARHRTVTVTTFRETEQGRRPFEMTYELRGWELWTGAPTTLHAQATLSEIIDEIAEARATDPELNDQHERLARRLNHLRESMRPIEDWAEAASAFFRDDNLHLVVDDTRAPATVENGGLVVLDGDERVRIDVTGETRVPRQGRS